MKRRLVWLLATLAFGVVTPAALLYFLLAFPAAFLSVLLLALWGGGAYAVGAHLWDAYFKPATRPLPERKDRRRRNAVSP